MFTGVIEDIGTIRQVDRRGDQFRVQVDCNFDTRDFELGESIAVNGACFTVVTFDKHSFDFEASPESLARTTLAQVTPGDCVHLERAAKLGSRLGGHLVLGHVDGVGSVIANRAVQNARHLQLEAPPEIAPLLVSKGSITIDGASLTVNDVEEYSGRFSVMIIPFTGQKTLLTKLAPGDKVNLEADIVGKYVQRLLRASSGNPQETSARETHADAQGSGLDMAFLERYGYVDRS